MLRACLMRRIAQQLKQQSDAMEENGGDDEREQQSSASGNKMSMHVDQTLRGVEETLSKCLLRLYDVSQTLRSDSSTTGGGGGGGDMMHLMSEMKAIMDEVTTSYSRLRSV